MDFDLNKEDKNETKGQKSKEFLASNGKKYENIDVYENEEMADYFIDDIDEMSMCEGSR